MLVMLPGLLWALGHLKLVTMQEAVVAVLALVAQPVVCCSLSQLSHKLPL